MKTLLVFLIILAGGYYYLVNYHFASRSDKFLDNYQVVEDNSSKDDDFEIDISQFEDKTPTNKKKKVKFDREVKIFYGINEAEGSEYKCDGRKRCTQMHSCEEATFFLKNCPGVMMDGDGDGVPCENQWCRKGVY